MDKLNIYRSEAALLEALRKGEATAFEALYRQHFRMIIRLTNEFGAVQIEPADLFQEVLLVLVRKVQDEDFRLSAKISTFLYAVARNLLLKKSSQKTNLPLDEGLLRVWSNEMADQESPNLEERLQAVASCLEKLEPECKKLLDLSFFEKRSQLEIAEIMSYATSFVKVKKHRCLNYLRSELRNHPLFEELFIL